MTTRSQSHEIDIPAPPETVFNLLITPSAIRGWWGAQRAIVMPVLDGLWVVAWGEREDDPDFVTGATIKAFESPRRLLLAYEYFHAKSGPLPFAAQMTAEFIIQKSPTGSHLRVTQAGFPAGREADAYFESCKSGWKAMLQGITQAAAARPPAGR